MFFSKMAGTFAESGWNFAQTAMLKMYARCLKKLHRKDEYTRTVLDILAKSAAQRKASLLPRRSKPVENGENMKVQQAMTGWLDDDRVDAAGYLTELVSFSNQMPYDVSVPMAKYFADIAVEPYLRHYNDKDGFQIRLQFRHLLQDDLEVQKVRVRLVSASSNQAREIWLESLAPQTISRGLIKLWLDCNVR